MQRLRDALIGYKAFWQEEPLGRMYSVASFIDDLGVAASLWASQLIMTRIYATQDARAQVMTPMIVCLILGTVLGGPLADSLSRNKALLPRRRWGVVLVVRALETIALGYLAWQISRGALTVKTVIPYAIVSGLLKALVRPTRQALEADILAVREWVSIGVAGKDLAVKVHLAPSMSLRELSGTVAGIAGLAAGGMLLSIVGDRLWILFAFDILTNVVFIVLVFRFCRPAEYCENEFRASSILRWRDVSSLISPRMMVAAGLGLLVGMVNEAYDGKMILMHVLHVRDEMIRLSELGWQVASISAILLLSYFGSADQVFSKAFPLLVALDGVVIVLAGIAAASGLPLAFAGVLWIDRFVTVLALYVPILVILDGTAVEKRGTALAAYTLCTLFGSLGAQQGAARLTRSFSVPQMMLGIGAFQAGIALAVLPVYNSIAASRRAESA